MLADEEGIFGSSMSDSTRAMVTDSARDILVVVYCFENDIDLDTLSVMQKMHLRGLPGQRMQSIGLYKVGFARRLSEHEAVVYSNRCRNSVSRHQHGF